MKANWLRWFLLFFLLGVVFQLPAQQSEADRKLLAEIRSKAENGDATAQFILGGFYFAGEGVSKNQVEAAKWLRRAAEQKLPAAQYVLGLSYSHGELGLSEDTVEAVKWFRKAAEQGFADGEFSLGNAYHAGNGVTKNDVEAAKWYRKAAEQGLAAAEYNLGICYATGDGVTKNDIEAAKCYRKAAERGFAAAQFYLGVSYGTGAGISKDLVQAVKWIRKAADQNYPKAQVGLGMFYSNGDGVVKDNTEAVKWFRKAAEQGFGEAQYNLGICYSRGKGVPEDYVEAHRWYNLASAQGSVGAKGNLSVLERSMTPEQIADAQRLARDFQPRRLPDRNASTTPESLAEFRPSCTGTGFFISEDGFFITNDHVIKDAVQVRLVTESGFISAKVLKVDSANDLALLKAEGNFAALPVAPSRSMRLGSTVATVGFPNIGLQGFAPKLAKGEIAALSGAQDDPKYFQISVPVQPGNSGGALVDEHGNVVGIVAAKLSPEAALASSGSLPENVNYAVKSSFLLSFLESVPDVAAKLKEPSGKDCRFEDVVGSAEKAAVLVLVY